MESQAATIDIHNPFYCPALPASAYLQTLRQTLMVGTNQHTTSLFHTFAKMLDRFGLTDGDSADFIYDSENDWIVGVNLGNRRRGGPAQGQLPLMPNEFTLSEHPPNLQSTVVNRRGPERKCGSPSSFSSLDPHIGRHPMAEHAKSVLFANDSSFELEVRHEKVNFDATGSPTLVRPATNSPASDLPAFFESEALLAELLAKVLTLLPGIRLEERLARIPDLTVQKVADLLGDNGYMSYCVLETFLGTGVTSLSLATSLSDEDGLNICRQDVIGLFGKPNGFQDLTELSFSSSRVEDFNLIHIHHLPKLSSLYLDDTGIGNEGVYLLVPLKRTLKKLSLATNPKINSESVPAIILLSNLEFLSILDTGVDITGLRILARTIFEEGRAIDIEIPYACEHYVDNLHSMYLIDPKPPLISSPDACDSLSTLALKKNLAAHAERNPAIVASGTREEMVSRLVDILTRRKLDLVVAQMLLGAA